MFSYKRFSIIGIGYFTSQRCYLITEPENILQSFTLIENSIKINKTAVTYKIIKLVSFLLGLIYNRFKIRRKYSVTHENEKKKSVLAGKK